MFVLTLVISILSKNQTNLTCPIVSEGIVGAYNRTNLPPSVTSLLSGSLFVLDKSGSPSASLVDKIDVNQDNTLFNITLKNGLMWNDGTAVKSSDIKINLPDIEVTYPNNQTISFKLADSFSPFLGLLTTPVLKPNSLVGLGKYKVNYQEINRGHISKLVLEPINKNSCKDNPLVSIRFYQDEQTIKTAFNLGEIDAILAIQDTNDFSKQSNVTIKKIQNYNKLVAIFYNIKDSILDKNYRKALNYSVNTVKGEDEADTSIPTISWAHNNDLKEVRGDIASAKTFLAKVETGKDKPVVITTSTYFEGLAQKVVEDWKKIGVNAVIRTESGNPQNFQALLTTVSIPHDPDQYALWHSTQTNTNISKYSSPRVDKDLEDGRKTTNIDNRKEKYFDFQKVIQDDVPATFLYFPKINIVYRKKVETNLNKILPSQIVQF
ncbi:MAG: ABC transporter substrate-binding protein [Candidatus Daviesbacteria bacterium]|nr:ABC transporter substrate-binding protein [Candidatus Daviesbacteria bacterium]